MTLKLNQFYQVYVWSIMVVSVRHLKDKLVTRYVLLMMPIWKG